MTETLNMNRERFLSFLAEGLCTVVFTKADGSTRRMHCTLNESVINLYKELSANENEATNTRKSNPDTIVVWDVEKKDWRSFRVDSVIDFLAP